jgi:hypothetical protein
MAYDGCCCAAASALVLVAAMASSVAAAQQIESGPARTQDLSTSPEVKAAGDPICRSSQDHRPPGSDGQRWT